MNKIEPESIDQYISQFPTFVQERLQKIRRVIHDNAPEATEVISYGMPTFKLQRNLVHFAAFKNHIGFYPAPSGIEKFKDLLSEFKTSKGAIQFPLQGEIPYDLIARIVRFRVSEEQARN